MAIAATLKSYLDQRDVAYGVVEHAPSATALESAHSAHVPDDQVAKAVVLKDGKGFVVAVVPSTNKLDFQWVRETLERELELANESQLAALFEDCEVGAVPALSDAYGLEVVWDDQLRGHADVYIEAGDHRQLIHITGESFSQLMSGKPHGLISAERDYSRL